ncbi:hypothetical protein INT48_005050 [Thamnidium elegans]|uniref:CUE domain-containing protein n=1 Tax=Thamnidium elegans TaxID=101142 RepID=A0A8H7VU63_9FUNG|nr:hypothetical protein INT48_005050 [Thamnidium elegans]
MLEFIPFIPSGTQGINETQWQIALHSWIFNLTELLNMPQDKFRSEVLSNTTLPSFIDQVLNEQMDNESQPVDTNLIKHIFLLYSRLSVGPFSTELLDIERLCSFVIVYGESNIEQVRRIMNDTVNNSETLERNLVSTIGSLIDSVQSMPDLLSNTKPLTADVLDRVYVLVHVLDALLSSTIHLSVIKSSFDTLDEVLINCYRNLIPSLKNAVENDSSLESHAYIIKLSLVSTFNSFADMQFFIPLGYTSSVVDHHQLIEHDTKTSFDSTISWMTDKLLGYLENSGLESSRNAFIDGPLIMDWEVEFCITEKLEFINQNKCDGAEERIEFLILSMEQVRDSNDGTGSWGDKYNAQKENRKTNHSGSVFQDVETTSKISQVHDLFPDLGDGFIEACLEANNNDVEVVIMQLLEDKLPVSVSGLDRSMERKPFMSATETVSELIHLESEGYAEDNRIKENVLKSRHNIYDNDEFDIFTHRTVDTSKVYEGKKDKANADALLEDKTFIQEEKKNVLKLVIDMYDDEYDDTYDDINDAGLPTVLESDDAVDIVRNKQAVESNTHTKAEKSESGSRNQPKGSEKSNKGPKGSEKQNQAPKNSEKQKQAPKNSEKSNQAPKSSENPKQGPKSTEKSKQGPKGPDKPKQGPKDPSKKDSKKPASGSKDRSDKVKNKAQLGNHNRKANRDKKMASLGPPPS